MCERLERALIANRSLCSLLESVQSTILKEIEVRQGRRIVLNKIIEKLENNDVSDLHTNRTDLRYCSRPYFKDAQGYFSPINEDAQKIQTFGAIDYTNLRCCRPWTSKDKKILVNATMQMYQLKISVELCQEIKRLMQSKKDDEKLSNCQLRMSQIQTKPELIIPKIASLVEIENDWEKISAALEYAHTPSECFSMWRIALHPSINRRPWTLQEGIRLAELVRINNCQDWEKIAKSLNTRRTAYQCFVYNKMRISKHSTWGQKWTIRENEYLKRVVNACRVGEYIPWAKVSYYIENRTKEQIYSRWHHMQNLKTHGRFTRDEDIVLSTAVQLYGNNFRKITTFLPGRNLAQVRNRYRRLSSRLNIVDWTITEDKLLIESSIKSVIDYNKLLKKFIGRSKQDITRRIKFLNDWMSKNPDKSFESIPRLDLNKMILNDESMIELTEKLQNYKENLIKKYASMELRKKRLITRSQNIVRKKSLTGIDKRLVNYFSNRSIKNLELIRMKQSSFTVKENCEIASILYLLNANMIKTNKVPIKTNLNKTVDWLSSKNIETLKLNEYNKYSVKKQMEISPINNVHVLEDFNLWNCSTVPKKLNPLNIFPPSYSTIIGLRTISLLKFNRPEYYVQFSKLDHPAESNLWKDRFKALFMWPILLASVETQINCDIFNMNSNSALSARLDEDCEVNTNIESESFKKLIQRRKKSKKKTFSINIGDYPKNLTLLDIDYDSIKYCSIKDLLKEIKPVFLT